MTTRFATTDDVPELARIINAAYRVEDFFIKGDRTSVEEIRTRIAAPDVRFLVIEAGDGGAIAATVCLDVHGGRGHFALLSVDPAFQGQGLGRLLVTAVEDYCRAAGCESLDLDVVNLREELPAFYTALGFVPFDTAPFSDTGELRRKAHLMLMTKSL